MNSLKSISASWFGSAYGIYGVNCLAGITDLRLLPFDVQGFHSVDLTMSLFMYVYRQCVAKEIITQVFVLLARIPSLKARRLGLLLSHQFRGTRIIHGGHASTNVYLD